MYSRITASSSPTVLTQYPRDQKFKLTKFPSRPYFWQIMIADFPLSVPMMCDETRQGALQQSFTQSILQLKCRLIVSSLEFSRHRASLPPGSPSHIGFSDKLLATSVLAATTA